MEILKGSKRVNETSHYARKSRRKGMVPGVLYGNKISSFLFEVSELELTREMINNGCHGIMNLDIDGEKHRTLIKEVQRDPVTNKLIHIDLEELDGNENIQSDVPVLFSNEAYILKRGGIVQKEKDTVKVECPPERLPKFIMASLKPDQIGTVIRIQDIEAGEEISFVEDPKTVIASISYVSTRDEVDETDEDEIKDK